MFIKFLFLLLPFVLMAGEIVWSSDASGTLSQSEHDKVVKEYVDAKYPSEAKAWNEKEKLIRANTVAVNGLMWQDNEDAKTVKRDWEDAKQYCADLELGGFSDWRLPSAQELKSIVDTSRSPAIKEEFRNTASSYYWSSSPNVSVSRYAWDVYFNSGDSYGDNKTDEYYVRCARAGQ